MNQRLRNAGLRFQSTFQKIDGAKFKGQILDLPDTSRVSNFLSARRYLRLMPSSNIKPTDVIIVDDMKFIVAEHGTGFYVSPIYKHMKLFQVDQILPWYKTVEVQDTVTKVWKKEKSNTSIALYLSTQPKPDIEDRTMIPTEQIQAVCDKPVGLGDYVGPYQVTKVDKELGIYLLMLKMV